MSNTALILYRTEDGLTELQLKSIDGTVWLTQRDIASLFNRDVRTINDHLQNIYEEKECLPEATIRKFRIVQTEGDRSVEREIDHYNLDMILAVGYRVKSSRGTQFRIWATTTLREYLVKGFVMNDERLKNPNGTPYFDEFLERIREIRASEKLFYQKVRDVYTKSMDYDPKSNEAQRFFKTVQNKMLYAVTGMTAAELIKHRSDATLPNMGLTHWEGSQKGRKVRKSDVVTAKNYLAEEEIANLNRIVTMFLDVAEDTAKNQQAMYMKDWEQRLDEFLQFNKRSILNGAGNVSHDHAAQIAHERYATFDLHRREQETIQAEREAADDLKELEKEITRKMRT